MFPMRSGTAPPIPVITTTCHVYERVLLADHVIIVAEGEAPAGVAAPFCGTRQCLLHKRDVEIETALLLKMVGG